MFQLLAGTNIQFMRHRRIAYAISILLTLATVVWLVANGGPRYSVDFTGGALLQIRLSEPLPADQIRTALEGAGIGSIELQQMTGESRNEYIIRAKTQESGSD